jgi:hypothetical protein
MSMHGERINTQPWFESHTHSSPVRECPVGEFPVEIIRLVNIRLGSIRLVRNSEYSIQLESVR